MVWWQRPRRENGQQNRGAWIFSNSDFTQIHPEYILDAKLHAAVFSNGASFYRIKDSKLKHDAKSDVSKVNGLCCQNSKLGYNRVIHWYPILLDYFRSVWKCFTTQLWAPALNNHRIPDALFQHFHDCDLLQICWHALQILTTLRQHETHRLCLSVLDFCIYPKVYYRVHWSTAARFEKYR